MRDMQEDFNTMVNHLFAQGHKALSDAMIDPAEDKFRCLYRAPNGDKCAFGVLISDKEYNPSMEGNVCDYVIYDLKWEVFNISFYLDMQQLHDNATTEIDGHFDMQSLFKDLQRIGYRYSLGMNVLYVNAEEKGLEV